MTPEVFKCLEVCGHQNTKTGTILLSMVLSNLRYSAYFLSVAGLSGSWFLIGRLWFPDEQLDIMPGMQHAPKISDRHFASEV